MNEGFDAKYIKTCTRNVLFSRSIDEVYEEHIVIPSYKEVTADKIVYAQAFKVTYQEQDPI